MACRSVNQGKPFTGTLCGKWMSKRREGSVDAGPGQNGMIPYGSGVLGGCCGVAGKAATSTHLPLLDLALLATFL